MTIVFLSPTGQVGGAEAALQEVVAALREAHPDWSLTVVAASDGPLVARIGALGAPVVVEAFPPALASLGEWGLGAGRRSRLAFVRASVAAVVPACLYLRRLRRRLRALRPDIVHSNGLKTHVLAACARPRGAAVVWHLHDYVSRRPVTSTLLRRLSGRCSAIVANSKSVAEDARRACGDRAPRHAVWNAVDLTRFSPCGPRLDLDALTGLPPAGDDVVKVGLVATLAKWKGHETFLEALSLLSSPRQVRGYVIGGAVYATADSQVGEDALRRRARALGLGDRVGFTGYVADPAAAMRALDVVVHASVDPEPFGLVIAEAMACGKAVVASGAGGALELAQSNTGVLMHAPGDAPDLARRIDELAGDHSLRRRLGASGREAAERTLTRERLARELTRVYEDVTATH